MIELSQTDRKFLRLFSRKAISAISCHSTDNMTQPEAYLRNTKCLRKRTNTPMSIPTLTQFPHPDDERLRGLLKSLASGMIAPIELAERAYRMGSEACHRAMEVLTDSQREIPLDLSEVERITISEALARAKGDKLVAARLLGIGKTTLYRKVAIYNIEPQTTMTCPACGHELRLPRWPKRIHNPATAIPEATAQLTASAPLF